MTQYIDKSAVVAEIEKRQSIVLDPLNNNIHTKRLEETYKSILSFINTLKVKEVKEEPVSNDMEEAAHLYVDTTIEYFDSECNPCCYPAFIAGAQWQKQQNTLETKDVNLEKELKILDNTLFDLDGVAIAGATHYLTVEDVKDIAKRFYELGLNTQKGE